MISTLAKVDEDLIADLASVVEELGGSFTIIDIKNKIFKLDVDSEFQDYASKVVNEIFNAYKIKRAILLTNNPFLGIEEIVKEDLKQE